MRIVADISTTVSGFLWPGALQRVMQAANGPIHRLFTSSELVATFSEVIQRPKFAPRLNLQELTPAGLVDRLTRLATVVQPAPTASVWRQLPRRRRFAAATEATPSPPS